MPPRETPDMPLPDLSVPDDTTFKGRLYKYGAGAESNVSDRRGEDEGEETVKRKKRKPIPPDEDTGKLSGDAGLNDIGKQRTMQSRGKKWYDGK